MPLGPALQMERYTRKLQELETLFTGMETGTLPVNDAQMERTIRAAEQLVLDLQSKAANLTGKSFKSTT